MKTARDIYTQHNAILSAPIAPIPTGPRPAAPIMRKERGTYTAPDGRIVTFEDAGDVTAPTILWWHGDPGGGLNPSYYAYPKTSFRHIQLAQPGCNGSTLVQPWSPEQSTDDAVAILAQLGISGPVLAAGHSWGSTMALLFASRHPELTRGVVVSGVWLNTPADIAFYLGNRRMMPGVPSGIARMTAQQLYAGLQTGALSPSRIGGIEMLQGRDGADPFADPGDTMPVGQMAMIELEMMARAETKHWALSLDFPTALDTVPLYTIQGRADLICRPLAAAEVADAWPGPAECLWHNGNHFGVAGVYVPGATPAEEQAVQQVINLRDGCPQLYFGLALDALR